MCLCVHTKRVHSTFDFPVWLLQCSISLMFVFRFPINRQLILWEHFLLHLQLLTARQNQVWQQAGVKGGVGGVSSDPAGRSFDWLDMKKRKFKSIPQTLLFIQLQTWLSAANGLYRILWFIWVHLDSCINWTDRRRDLVLQHGNQYRRSWSVDIEFPSTNISNMFSKKSPLLIFLCTQNAIATH